MMDFTYYNQDCFVEIYVGKLEDHVILKEEKHPLVWISKEENFLIPKVCRRRKHRTYGRAGKYIRERNHKVTMQGDRDKKTTKKI